MLCIHTQVSLHALKHGAECGEKQTNQRNHRPYATLCGHSKFDNIITVSIPIIISSYGCFVLCRWFIVNSHFMFLASLVPRPFS